MQETVYLEVEKGLKIISARIIALTNQKKELESEIKIFEEKREELKTHPTFPERYRRKILDKQRELSRVEEILTLNKLLLPHTDSHLYQLEN